MKPLVVVAYEHPGGEAAVRPVIDQLNRDGKVRLLINPNRFQKCDLVLTATDADPYQRCGNWIRWAKYNHVPSVAVLDFWSNYRRRFEVDSRLCVPDTICVMDELAVHEMMAEGFERSWLTITGQPAFDRLAEVRAGFTDRRKYWTQRYYGFRQGRRTIVFVSQPLSLEPYDYGFTEHDVLPLLIDALPDDVDLIIRPHPREPIDNLARYAKGQNITVQRKGLVHELLMAADLVVGMNSELLVEACYLGCSVLSLQPGRNEDDRLPTNRAGFSVRITDKKYLKGTIQTQLDNGLGMLFSTWLEMWSKTRQPAAPKVAAVVYERLGL